MSAGRCTSDFPSWQLRRAGMLGIAYGRVEAPLMKTFQTKFMNMTKHDDVPVSPFDTFNYHKAFEESMKVFDESYDKFSGAHTHLSYPARRIKADGHSMLERFTSFVNDGAHYKLVAAPDGFGIDDFPGPGIVIYGLKGKAFSEDFLYEDFYVTNSHQDSPFTRVQKHYRRRLVESEKDLSDTTFGLFKGLIIIRNPKMTVDKKRYALVILNNHFHNPTQQIAFLVPDGHAKFFLKDPTKSMNRKNIFYPERLGSIYEGLMLDITCPSILGGMDKALPVAGVYYENSKFYDYEGEVCFRDLLEFERIYGTSETYEPLPGGYLGHLHRTHMFGGYWNRMDTRNLIPFKVAHDEITNAALTGYALFDLLQEAFRLHCYGYGFNNNQGLWQRDEYRLLRDAIGMKDSQRITEKPLLVPVERLRCASINPTFLNSVGFVDTKDMILHRPEGNSQLPQKSPNFGSGQKEHWELFGGTEETKNWHDFIETAYYGKTDLIFVHPHIMPQLLDIMKKSN